jgi:hypothetical protein
VVSGLKWRKTLPSQPTQRWTFVHQPSGNPDPVVTLDGTNDQCKVVIANDAARVYLDTVDDGAALTFITSRYTPARQRPITLTLARREWRLTELERQAQAALADVLQGDGADLARLRAQTLDMRRQLDALNDTLLTV